MVGGVADEVPDQSAAEAAALGLGARTSTGPATGRLPIPVDLADLYGFGSARPALTERT